MKEIKLTQGKVALVDDADYEWLSQWKWTYGGYAFRMIRDGTRKQRMIYMHRVIMDAQPGEQVDHINRDGLDNRRENLRLCSSSQNNGNQRKTRGSSRFKGVSWHKEGRKWQTGIKLHGTQRHLGLFTDEVEAAHAYDDAAREKFGEFARVNFPVGGEQGALRAEPEAGE